MEHVEIWRKMAQYRGFHRDKFAQVSPKCPDPQIAHQRPFMREGCAPATWGRVEKTFQPHWSAQITLRARAALTDSGQLSYASEPVHKNGSGDSRGANLM